MSKKIKVLVVDDSSIMRLLITDILKKDKSIGLIDKASNGKEAIEMTLKENPDVILMDMNMGQYDGVYAVENIMKLKPTPIIMLSAVGNTNLKPIMEAIHLGALDYLNKPADSSIKLKNVGEELVNKVKSAAQSNLTNLIPTELKKTTAPHTFSSDLNYDIIVIGASTGGPTAVEKVISQLPANLAVPVVIAQHMPKNFIPSFVSRINRLSPLTVKVGSIGDKLRPGYIYVSPGDSNMILKQNEETVEIGFTKRKYPEYNYPSVTALMESAAQIYGKKTVGVILTGMGSDGKRGVGMIKNAGGLTIAQNKETSVVFGMPREAINSGKVDEVVALNEIGFFLVSSLN